MAVSETEDVSPQGSPTQLERQLILSADDFGRCSEVNAAVVQAHRQGVLTSASLMVTGEAFEEAVELARRLPRLAVGLHVVLVDGRAALPPAKIPHLVDRSGRFLRDPVRAGLRYFFSRSARAELEEELEAQLARFAATGLPLSHIDGHLHMHLHPTVLARLLPLAHRYEAGGFRLPRDRFWLAWRSDRRRLLRRAGWAVVFPLLGRWCRSRLHRWPLPVAARTYGLMQSGNMHERYLLQLLEQIREPSAEIYFHPTAGPRLDPLGPNSEDLSSLVSPAIRQAIERHCLQLTTYPKLNER